jgi:hypothetical protein
LMERGQNPTCGDQQGGKLDPESDGVEHGVKLSCPAAGCRAIYPAAGFRSLAEKMQKGLPHGRRSRNLPSLMKIENFSRRSGWLHRRPSGVRLGAGYAIAHRNGKNYAWIYDDMMERK